MPVSSLLVLGGVRSGKSAYAEQRLLDMAPGTRAYVATAEVIDEAMRERIERHRARRDPSWRLVEAPIGLPAALARESGPVLVDCVSVWLTNLLVHERPVDPAMLALLRMLEPRKAATVIVSNEVGLGGIETHALARRFADHQGQLNQDLARWAEEVVLVTAGLPLTLKAPPAAP